MKENPYTLIHLTDPLMGIDSNDIPDRKARSALHAKVIAGIKFVFPVGVFVFKRYGSIANWVVLCRII